MKGLFAANTLRRNNQIKRRHDTLYRKRYLGKIYKGVIGTKPQAVGIVLKKDGLEAKQPNSAVRKICRVQIISTGKTLMAFAPGDGCLNLIQENDQVTIEGQGRSGKSVGDMPGIKYKIVKVRNVSVDAVLRGKKEMPPR
jgi:small subunit ribosomal protein S23e